MPEEPRETVTALLLAIARISLRSRTGTRKILVDHARRRRADKMRDLRIIVNLREPFRILELAGLLAPQGFDRVES